MASVLKKQMVQLALPWYTPDGELCYSPMTLSQTGKVDKRKAKKIVTDWYKKEIGVNLTTDIFDVIWKGKFITYAMDETMINNYLQQMARRTYEETIEGTDTKPQEESSR